MPYRLLLILLAIFYFPDSGHCQLPAPFTIIPEPKKVQLLPGAGMPAASEPTIIDRIDSTPGSFIQPEAYRLQITKTRILITAATQTGLFYGHQSLQQLLEDADRFKKDIPAMIISDHPSMRYRAVHLDVKHHLDHLQYYYQAIDRLAKYKINAVIFEFEDKLRYRRQPLVGTPNAISIEEMAALTTYARKKNIEITPLVQGLGHASYILKHEAYQPLREIAWNDWAFCPLNEGTYQVLFDLYRDAIAATPGSRYLHIGGDEIGNIGICERCRPFVEKYGKAQLNLYWLKKVSEFAAKQHRIPIFWDDMPLQECNLYETTWNEKITPQQADSTWQKQRPSLDSMLTAFPANSIFMRWNYSAATQPGNLLCLDWYHDSKLPVMIATAVNAEGGPLFQPDIRNQGSASAGNSCIKSFIELAADRNIDGMLCTAWDDRSPHLENDWPGFIAAAEYSWSPHRKTLEALDAAWTDKEFGISISQWPDLQKKLRTGSEYWYEALFEKGNWFDDDNMLQSLKQVEHWLKPLQGREKIPFDYSTKIISLPEKDHPGAWSKKYRLKLEKAAACMKTYPSLMASLQQLETQSVRNKYYWRLQTALCRFQSAPPALLLVLQQIDNAASTGYDNLNAAIAELQNAYSALADVYAETRFLQQPPGFIPDRYFHMASQREDLSWMIQAQQLLIEKIDRQLTATKK